jgi:tetratricopeptide (TPR) repeat protein
VVAKSDEELNRLLNDLQLGEFIYEQPATGGIEYIFKHALTQEVACNSVLMERRRQLHERTAAALETLYASSVEEHLAELAHHYVRSSNLDKAVEYLTRAGLQARQRSAFAEAQAQLQLGLEWIKQSAESPERDARELELASILAQVLLVTRGFTAPETRAAAERARELAEKSGNLAQLVVQVFGIFRNVIAAGDLPVAGFLAGRILDLAQREGNPANFGLVCYAEVYTNFFRGDLAGAEERFARWGGFFDGNGFRQVPGVAVAAIATASFCAVALGHAEKARERIARMIAFAQDNNNPYDLGAARLFESALSHLLREAQQAETAATQALAISEEHGFPFLRDLTCTELGWAQAQLGRAGEGIALIRKGLANMAEAGFRLSITAYLTFLAEAQALDGKVDDALTTIEEALQANPQELVYQPNALNLRGELRRKVG